MNVQLKDITVTARDGRVSHLEQVYIRGSHVRFFIVPDMLRYDPPLQLPRSCKKKMLLTYEKSQECAHVPKSQRPRTRCRSGPRQGDGQQSARWWSGWPWKVEGTWKDGGWGL
jgi:hypothetical protein